MHALLSPFYILWLLVFCVGVVACTDREAMQERLAYVSACNRADTVFSARWIPTVDSLVEFFDGHGSPNDRMMAHYLQGRVHHDMGEAPHALECYQNAVECADTTAKDCNYRILTSVYGQMAELFHRQNLPQDEMWAREQSCRYYLAYGDTIGYIRSQELKAKIYAIIGDTTRIIQTILKTHRLYKKQDNEQLAVGGYATLAYICLNRNQIDEAKKLLNDYEKHSGIFDKDGVISKGRESYFYIKGSYYIKINRLDSAEHYMRKLLIRGNETDAFRGLLTIYQQKKNTDSIIKYAHLYEDAVREDHIEKKDKDHI